MARSLNLAINRLPREALPSSFPPRRGSEGSNRSSRNGSSNRASLVVTHDDGSTEDVETEVTCLGLSMDSSWGAPGGRGGLTIQELGGEEISLNSFLSDISGEPIYADAEPIYDIVGEVDEEDSGTSTPELLLPPCQVEAEIHPFSDRQTLDMSKKTNSVEIVNKPNSSPFPVGTPDVLETRIPSSPPKSGDKTVGSQKEDASPTTLAPISTESSQSSESDNCGETSVRRDRLPPTPSPTPPSLLSTPSASPVRASSPSINLSTPIPITRNSNPSPTPTSITPNAISSSVIKTPTANSPSPRSRPNSPPPPRPSSPPPPLPPSHSPPLEKSPAASPQSFASSAPQHSRQGTETPERTVVRRVSVEKDVRREEIVIEEKMHNVTSCSSEMTVGQSEPAENAAKVYTRGKGLTYVF